MSDMKNNMEDKISKVIEERINPKLDIHDGSAALTSFQNGVAYVKLLGACASCIEASGTFETVVKAEIMAALPEIDDVILDDSTSEELLDMARKILSGGFK